jgi:bifunctional polynucleotide phosphatase/kinase
MFTWNYEFIKNKACMCYYLNINKQNSKILAFDLDHTLIKPKRTVFPRDIDDWVYVFENVKIKLKEYHNKGYNIVVFSNQGGFDKKREIILGRIERFLIDNSEIPISVFISTSNDLYRKPNLGMWDYYKQQKSDLNLEESMFVGDASGRVFKKNLKLKNDFSSSDIKFAHNIGIKFLTPEEFFQNKLIDDRVSHINLCGIGFKQLKDLKSIHKFSPQNPELFNTNLEMIILVGYPGCGKSTFKKSYVSKGYFNIEKDSLNMSKSRYLTLIKTTMKDKKRIIIDSTNPDPNSRKLLINLCKECNYKVRCLYFNIDRELSEHLNNFRMKLSKGLVEKVPSVVYNVYDKKFVLPSIDEGFNEIIYVNFVPDFNNNIEEVLFYQYS